MRSIEIPYVKDRGRRYRFFEMLPGLITWSILLLPFVLSQLNPRLCVFFIIAYLLLWFVKALGLNVRALQGYRLLQQHQKLPWAQMLQELTSGKVGQPERHIPAWHYENILRIAEQPTPIKPEDITHVAMIATYNESREILEPTIQSVIDSAYDMKQVVLVIAYEERGGPDVEAQANQLIADYKHHFKHAMAVKHPKDMRGEVIGKGGNITYAARELEKYVTKAKLDPLSVIVTTLDADNRPHKFYEELMPNKNLSSRIRRIRPAA